MAGHGAAAAWAVEGWAAVARLGEGRGQRRSRRQAAFDRAVYQCELTRGRAREAERATGPVSFQSTSPSASSSAAPKSSKP
jgi:hypothetical protein